MWWRATGRFWEEVEPQQHKELGPELFFWLLLQSLMKWGNHWKIVNRYWSLSKAMTRPHFSSLPLLLGCFMKMTIVGCFHKNPMGKSLLGQGWENLLQGISVLLDLCIWLMQGKVGFRHSQIEWSCYALRWSCVYVSEKEVYGREICACCSHYFGASVRTDASYFC